MNQPDAKEKSPNYGGYWGHKFFHVLIRLFGVSPAYWFVYLILPYYLLIRRSAVKSAAWYLKKRFPDDGPFRRWLRTYGYFNTFARIIIDQAATGILGYDALKSELPEADNMLQHVRDRRGMLLLNSHLGAWQSAMGTMGVYGNRVHFLFRVEEHTRGRHFFDLADERGEFKIISPDSFLGGMVELSNVLLEGGSVAMMGDRTWGAKTIKTEFLGREAHFPVTPYRLAVTTDSDLFMIMAVRTGKMSIRIDTVKLNEGMEYEKFSRDDAIRMLLERYVQNLEKCLSENPYFWLNFYDFWHDPPVS